MKTMTGFWGGEGRFCFKHFDQHKYGVFLLQDLRTQAVGKELNMGQYSSESFSDLEDPALQMYVDARSKVQSPLFVLE